MRIAFLGNFAHPHNTEVHLAAALREWGETVFEMQISPATVRSLPRRLRNRRADILLWVHTSHLAPNERDNHAALDAVKQMGILTAAFHLDRYWDLREDAIRDQAWFRSDVVMTADEGRGRWADAGINHVWVPPACHGPDAELIGVPQDKYRCKVAFVGSWQRYHQAWPWRTEMIRLLRERYGDDFLCAPDNPRERIYGQELSDLYASADVVVGDSIFAGMECGRGYTSDRPYLTLGQGGCLAMPANHPLQESFVDGEHLVYFEARNRESMFEAIDYLLNSPASFRENLREQGKQEVLTNHLYRHRCREMLQVITESKCSILGWPGEVRPFTHDATAIRETWLDDVYMARGNIHPGDRVIDCGGNVGAFSIFAAMQGAHVTTVEPVPNNLAQLKKNIALAGVAGRIDIIESAVGEKNGTIKLDFFDTDESQSAYRRNDDEGRIEVPVRTLNEIIAGAEVDFLKMDIEGSERFALPGADLSFVKRIAIETHNTLDPGTTHERVKGWLAPTHDIVHESGGHSEGYVIAVRRDS